MTAANWLVAGIAAAVVLVPCLFGPIRRYRVVRGGVVLVDQHGSCYCVEATSPVPVADEMPANKLLLETDERRFLASAHRFPYR
jgi:hypothetical protein